MSQENVAQKDDLNQQEAQATSEVNNESNTLVQCEKNVHQLEERLRYLSADFDNYRRNADKDRAQWFNRAQGEVLLDIISIVDDFERAFQAAENQIAQGNTDLASWLEGFSLIKNGMLKMLDKYQVQAMSEQGEFDPEMHEALQQVASEDHESGHIVTVIRKGYLYKGNVLRTAQVTVAA